MSPAIGGIELTVDGVTVHVDDPRLSLLAVLRDQIGNQSVKDGCSPQGQCGCCTVLVDGQPRVACVTPVRRVAGRSITTLDGLPPEVRDRWLSAFTAFAASQCGFCTPGIIVRLAATTNRSDPQATVTPHDIEGALGAHLCRCTGWGPIVDAAVAATAAADDHDCGQERLGDMGMVGRNPDAAARRASLEGGCAQQVGARIAAGQGGFAADTAPADALVALPDDTGGWVVAPSLAEARLARAKVQGRRTTQPPIAPLELPDGQWDLTLRTTWVEPAYLETDASWCTPGGQPASPLANGGAFGAKTDSLAPDAARHLADTHQRTVLVLLDREDTVRLGPKRPPIAAGIRTDGSGVVRVVDTPGIEAAIASVAPALSIETVQVPGPPTSAAVRGAGWVEAAVLLAAAGGHEHITTPAGATAAATIDEHGSVHVRVACGDPLDVPVLTSYCTGAAHMAIGWVTSEGLSVSPDGTIGDLTIRSFGVLRASATPTITVTVDDSLGDTTGTPVPGGDAVFAAVALAVWRHQGFPPAWPTGQPLRSR